MTPEEIRDHATDIILDHAQDVEFLSISEHLEDLGLSEAEHADACNAIDEAIREATVTVEWPSGRDPVTALRDLAAETRAEGVSTPAELAMVAALDAAADAYPTDDSPVVQALARFAVALADAEDR
jgi:hypothetical protein